MENKEETIIDGQNEKVGVKKESTKKKNNKGKEVLKNVGVAGGSAIIGAAIMGATRKPEDVPVEPEEEEPTSGLEDDVMVHSEPAPKHDNPNKGENPKDDEPVVVNTDDKEPVVVPEEQLEEMKEELSDQLKNQLRDELRNDEGFRSEVKEDLMNDEDFKNEIIAEVKKDVVTGRPENPDDSNDLTVSINPDDDDVEIINSGFIPTEDGGEMPYAVLDSGGTAVGIFDTTGNGEVDMVVIDVNQSKTVDDEDAFIDVSERQIPMETYCTTEEPVDESMLADNIGSDFNNEADISDIAIV